MFIFHRSFCGKKTAALPLWDSAPRPIKWLFRAFTCAASAFRRFQRHILEHKAQRVAGNQIVSHPAV